MIEAKCEKWEVCEASLLIELADVKAEVTMLGTLKAATTMMSNHRRGHKYYELKETKFSPLLFLSIFGRYLL